ncbi:hypothetical protein R1flu_028361 [Riccia fluitans]|uniref:Uncharacterized protein n=1 Tax=Riccia fluitans TaxID=41844 RepID=A0ABD1XLF6_9MARC
MSSEEKAERKKEKKKDKKENKHKEKKESDKNDSKGDEKEIIPFKNGKQRKQRRSVTFSDEYPFDQAYKDECVQDALRLMFLGLEAHIKDLAIYPRVVAHAVSKTVAHMVQMLCYSEIRFMRTWDDIQGRAQDEWDVIPELNLPPIDTWARCVIPMKLSSVPMTFNKPVRSEEGQFQILADPSVYHEPQVAVPRLLRRASETTLIKKVKKCNHCILLDKKEGRRRASEPLSNAEKQREKMLEGVRRRLSAYIRDQAMLNKILREKGLLDGSRSDTALEHNHNSSVFETY